MRRSLWLLLALFSAAQAQSEDNRTLWAEAQISETRPYVQQTLIYMVLVVSQAGLAIVDPVPPVVQGVSLVRLDEQPLNYPVNFKGKRYQVTAFRYALTPLTLGQIEIPPAKLKITYAASQWSGPQPRGKEIELASNKLSLDSQPPASAQQPWLPLYALRLNGKLDKSVVARAGEPLNLTLSLHATGAGGDQLPSLAPLLEKLADFKVYLERPQTTQEVVSDENLLFLSGSRSETFTLIPQRSGQLELPPLRLNWWNVKENKETTVEWGGLTLAVVESGAPRPEERGTTGRPVEPPAIGTGLPLLWQLAINIVLFLLGLWVGAGHPGSQRAYRLLRRGLLALLPWWEQARAWLGRQWDKASLADLRRQAASRRWLPQISPQRLASAGNRWVPGRFKALRLMRAIDAAENPGQIYQALARFAHERLEAPPRLPLSRLPGSYCRAYPRLPLAAVEKLFNELDQALYANPQEFDIYAWKDRFDEIFGSLPFRSPTLARAEAKPRGLPALNPLG